MVNKFNLIAAAASNGGIGKNGDLPWRLKNEMSYFNRMTTTVKDPSKKNMTIMGRKTYFSIPASKRPLVNRINVVLSKTSQPSDYPNDVLLFDSVEQTMKHLQNDESLAKQVETIWIVGGYGVYKEAMESVNCHRVYLTEIMAEFDCDTFFPSMSDHFKLVNNDDEIPSEMQEENGIKYQFKIYERNC